MRDKHFRWRMDSDKTKIITVKTGLGHWNLLQNYQHWLMLLPGIRNVYWQTFPLVGCQSIYLSRAVGSKRRILVGYHVTTRSFATADGPRDTRCQSKSCHLLHNCRNNKSTTDGSNEVRHRYSLLLTLFSPRSLLGLRKLFYIRFRLVWVKVCEKIFFMKFLGGSCTFWAMLHICNIGFTWLQIWKIQTH